MLVEDGDVYDELRGVEIVGKAVVHDDREPFWPLPPTSSSGTSRSRTPTTSRPSPRRIANKRVAIEIVPEKVV